MVPFCGDRKVVMLIIIVNTDDQTASLARSNNSNNSRRLFANSDPGNIGARAGQRLIMRLHARCWCENKRLLLPHYGQQAVLFIFQKYSLFSTNSRRPNYIIDNRSPNKRCPFSPHITKRYWWLGVESVNEEPCQAIAIVSLALHRWRRLEGENVVTAYPGPRMCLLSKYEFGKNHSPSISPVWPRTTMLKLFYSRCFIILQDRQRDGKSIRVLFSLK